MHYRKFLLSSTSLAASLYVLATPAYANPEIGVVSAGQAVITSAGKNLDVLQQSGKAVIDWRSFDIAADEKTEFHQPSSNSIALNRINDSKPSNINGQLKANGNLILINQNGMLFGKGAQVDVNGIMATSADISNDKFMNDTKLSFDKPGSPDAVISNQGTITVKEAGLAGLVAPNVVNNGLINAKLGTVHLASGDKATVDLYGDGLMEVTVSDKVSSQIVANTGTINAAGGKIALTAAAGKQIVKNIIIADGELNAPAVKQKNGEILIYSEGSNAVKDNIAADKGKKQGSSTVLVSGKLDASGRNAGESGGKITITGDNVKLKSGAILNASGNTGGGSINIGGDYQGKGLIAAAHNTTIEKDAVLNADAVLQGNGGTIIIWADQDTDFKGSIFARGGDIWGNGGFVEVSGKNKLSYNGVVNLLATKGTIGDLLLDPTNITISVAADSNVTGSSPYQPNADDVSSNLNTTTLQNALALANVTVQTRSTGSQAGNITVSDPITWGASTSLSLVADNNISINAAITGNTLNLTAPGTVTQTAALNLTNLSLSGTGGIYTLTNSSNSIGTVAGNTGSINLANGNNNLTVGTVNSISGITTTGNTTLSAGSGTITTSQAIATGSGNLTLTADDLALGASLSGSGTVTLQPTTTNKPIYLNYGSANGTNLNLSTTEFGYLVDGWSNIIIGALTNNPMSFGATTWNDPVSFRASTPYIYGDLNGNGNASITFSGFGNLSLYGGNIITAGNAFTNNLYLLSITPGTASITTNGGNVVLNGEVDVNGGGANLTISTSGGNISVNDRIVDFAFGGSTVGKLLTLNAGSGTLAFANTVNGAYSLTSTAANMTFNGALGGTTPLGSVSLTATNSLTLPSITASSILARTTGASGDITIPSGRVLTASGSSNALTLAAGRNFINNAGSGALSASNGRWLVYSNNPADTTGEETLTSNFNRYSCTYSTAGNCAGGTITMPSTGNGLLYSYSPTLTVTPTGISVTYGDTVPSLSGYAYNLTGYLGSDSGADSVTGSLTGTTAYTQGSDVGSYNINYASGSLASALGYTFSYANNATALTVNTRTLTAALTGTVSKTYDATIAAALASNNYTLSNIYSSDDVSLNNYTSGTYNNKNVGTGKNISVSGLTLTGSKAANYTLASGSVNGNVGTITQAALSITGVSANNKVYDGTTTATLNTGSAALSGVLLTDTVNLDSGSHSASFADKNVGTGKSVTASGFSISGSDAGNYAVSQPSGLTANITARNLTITANNKSMTYADGNNYNGFGSSGLQNGETIGSVSYATNATFSTSGNWNAGTWAITPSNATGGTFSASNYNITYANGSLNIAQKTLTLDATGINKIYDGTRTANVTFTDDRVTNDIFNRSYSALFDTRDAGTGKSIAVSSMAISGTDAANYQLTSTTDTATANIDKAPLTITGNNATKKLGYDNPTLTASYTGFVNGEDASVLNGLIITTTATKTSLKGYYPVTPANATAMNYDISYVNGTLTITNFLISDIPNTVMYRMSKGGQDQKNWFNFIPDYEPIEEFSLLIEIDPELAKKFNLTRL